MGRTVWAADGGMTCRSQGLGRLLRHLPCCQSGAQRERGSRSSGSLRTMRKGAGAGLFGGVRATADAAPFGARQTLASIPRFTEEIAAGLRDQNRVLARRGPSRWQTMRLQRVVLSLCQRSCSARGSSRVGCCAEQRSGPAWHGCIPAAPTANTGTHLRKSIARLPLQPAKAGDSTQHRHGPDVPLPLAGSFQRNG
jgi:hypothetical protein